MLEGTAVRVAGQDTRRGTFSQRHGVLVDQLTEAEYVPLAHLADDQAPFMLYDTVLSEYAALGFEYGYSVMSDALVCWEAQFGDFANGAQIVIDQFVVAANDKWGQRSRLGLLLPHGFEGQGPEHSSARIERYLTLCADGNMRVVYPSTAAQYFHVLRRQVHADATVPMVCFTPKRYLRHAAHARDARRAHHRPVRARARRPRRDRAARSTAASVSRVLVCTGKLAHELMDERDDARRRRRRRARGAALPVARAGAARRARRVPRHAREVWWVQEEPENMGAWTFVFSRLSPVLRGRELHHVARDVEREPGVGQRHGARARAARHPRRRPRHLNTPKLRHREADSRRGDAISVELAYGRRS